MGAEPSETVLCVSVCGHVAAYERMPGCT